MDARTATLSRLPWPALLLTLAGLVPLGAGSSDPQAFATWLALVAPALGVLAGARARGGALALPVVTWILALAFVNGRVGGSGFPRADFAGLAVTGLFCAGAAVGAARGMPVWRTSALVLLLTGFLAALATGAGALREPWPPALAARLLDLSPVGFVLECGGVDWMRDPSIYEGAGTASIPPDLRGGWVGSRAAPTLALVALLGFLIARSTRAGSSN